ncbi:MAG: hypothetical protein IPK82_26020 [Polyangiaceae bacterium]|nr:hypothetical protein [Polyangiaceae bacterium]
MILISSIAGCDSSGDGTGGSGGQGANGGGGNSTSSGTAGGDQGGAGGQSTTSSGAGTTSSSGGTGGSMCGPCGANAACDEQGACVCDPGFSGDGQECIDVNECIELPNTCHPSADCVNEPGAYSCACPSGTVGEPEPAGIGCSALYSEVSAGTYHTCVRRIDNAVLCFGNGGSGRLGNGLSANQNVPTQAGAAYNWKKVRAGGTHTCGIKDTGNIWCWGANSFGQLGLGHTDTQLLPAYTSLDSKWVDLATGETPSCAVGEDGTLSCWGRNNVGQLGTGSSNATELSPVKVSVDPMAASPDADWKMVVAGRDNTCALKNSGKLYCWGQNSNLQTSKTGGGFVNAPFLVETAAGAADSDWDSISTGLASCAVKIGGALYCWGRNAEGELGDGTTTQSAAPKQVMAGTNFKLVRVGYYQVCGITTAGALHCWGRNQTAQIQAGSAGRILSPVQVGTDTDWVDIAAGLPHTCGIKGDGHIHCWGARVFGNTGDGQFGYVTEPTQVGSADGYTLLSAFGEDTCVKDKNAKLTCFGNGELGQMGTGSTQSEQSPLLIPGAPAVSDIAPGRQHTCIVTQAGGLQCTGSNSNGALATGNTTNSTLYQNIASAGKPWAGLNWKAVASGELHSCAIATDNSLWCWGYNCYGQVDSATAASNVTSLIQVLPATAKDWVNVVAGQFHTCASRTDGSLWCWGRNNTGQIGNDAPAPDEAGCANKTGPFNLGAGWSSQISAGVNHTCAVRTDGTLRCWGGNANSQLGDNTTTERRAPVQIGTDVDWAQISAGNVFTCGLKTTGSLYCWGANGTGQLGVGDLGGRKVPTVVGSATWKTIQLGYAHACALQMDGTLWCWGSGEYGQNALGLSWFQSPTAIAEAK